MKALIFIIRWYAHLAKSWFRYAVLRKDKTSKRGSHGTARGN